MAKTPEQLEAEIAELRMRIVKQRALMGGVQVATFYILDAIARALEARGGVTRAELAQGVTKGIEKTEAELTNKMSVDDIEKRIFGRDLMLAFVSLLRRETDPPPTSPPPKSPPKKKSKFGVVKGGRK